MEQKIHNTFTRMEIEIEKFDKVFAKGGRFEQAVAQNGGDIAWFNDIREALDKLSDVLMDGHRAAMPDMDEDVTESKLTEGVLDADDDDGFMARSQLYFMARDAIQLHSIIGDTDDLEPWVQSKIAQAAQGMDAVRRYTEYNAMKQEMPAEMPQQPEAPAEMPQQPEAPMDMEESTLSEHDMSLLMDVIEQMKKDVEAGDYTAIDELLKNVPAEELQAFVSQIDEGMGKKLGTYALAAMLGLGAVKGIDATSAKHSPLGQALDHASQTWSGEEAAEALELYKNIDLHADENSSELRYWASQNQDLINQFKESTVDEGDYGKKKKKKKYYEEAEDKPYICVHAKKGKHECHAGSSYEAAKKAAAHWKMKSTAGIDAHLAVEETVNEGMEFDEKRNDDLQTVAKDLFANAKAAAAKKVK